MLGNPDALQFGQGVTGPWGGTGNGGADHSPSRRLCLVSGARQPSGAKADGLDNSPIPACPALARICAATFGCSNLRFIILVVFLVQRKPEPFRSGAAFPWRWLSEAAFEKPAGPRVSIRSVWLALIAPPPFPNRSWPQLAALALRGYHASRADHHLCAASTQRLMVPESSQYCAVDRGGLSQVQTG